MYSTVVDFDKLRGTEVVIGGASFMQRNHAAQFWARLPFAIHVRDGVNPFVGQHILGLLFPKVGGRIDQQELPFRFAGLARLSRSTMPGAVVL